MKNIYLFILIFLTTNVFGQTTYKAQKMPPIKYLGTVPFGGNDNAYMATVEPIVYPSPVQGGDKLYLAAQKRKSAALYPRKEVIKSRSALPSPEVLKNFGANGWFNRTPLDNHLAISNDGQIVSVINTHMLVMNDVGFWQANQQLDEFFSTVSLANRIFDPRVMYDPEADKWIISMMNGDVCGDSELLFAFSETNDATGNWNLYSIDGCPFQDVTFADYPMMSLIGDDFFFTYNGVRVGESWQLGFKETIIWQIDKNSGYNGSDLKSKMWTDIKTNGRNVRNICPVKNATEELPESAFFLSNRNLDIENDSIFIIQVIGGIDDPDASLEITIRKSSQPYGAPPSALQPVDSLATNDARVLDAFVQGDHIQFVSNTIDFESGRPAVYHGIVEDAFGSKAVTGHIIGSEDDLGYPGIAYVGLTEDERDVIIAASHSSETRFPGNSVLFADGFGQISDWVTIKEGQKEIDNQGAFTRLERWGDYCGIQRDYLNPDRVWTSASYGRYSGHNNTWVGYVAKPTLNVGTKETPKEISNVTASPNPASGWVNIRISLTANVLLEVDLLDINGLHVDQITQADLLAGDHMIHFNTYQLPAGTYLVRVMADRKEMLTKKVVVQ